MKFECPVCLFDTYYNNYLNLYMCSRQGSHSYSYNKESKSEILSIENFVLVVYPEMDLYQIYIRNDGSLSLIFNKKNC